MVMSFNNMRQFLFDNCSFVKKNNIDQIIDELRNELLANNYDLDNIKIIGFGETSINFVNNDEVIRLTFIRYNNYDTLKEYVSKCPKIAQPISERVIGDTGASIIHMHQYDTDNITEEDIKDTYINLRNDDYLPFDLKPNNFGKDKEGNVFMIDYGELIYIKDKPLFLKKADLESHSIRCPEYDKMYKKYLKKIERKNKLSFLKRFRQDITENEIDKESKTR